jgi:hypothetical protein
VPEIGEALRSVTAKRVLAVAEADAVAEDFFVEAVFVESAVVEDAFALEIEADEEEFAEEAGVDADAGTGRPSSARAKADGRNVNPKTANNMAATATLTVSPLECAQMRVLRAIELLSD